MLESPSARPEAAVPDQEWDVAVPGSAALQRLIDEVRVGGAKVETTAYNRTYHRHNR